jgi:hypothetical protein
MPRRSWFCILMIVCLTAHVWAAAQMNVPSQDGLKFIRIAREFGRQPAWYVIRSADQHPLYPILIAAAHAAMKPLDLSGAVAWRVAAQAPSIIAALATLWPLYSLTLRLFRPATALLSVFLWILLPMPFAIGHETLSDSVALCALVWALLCCVKATEAESIGRQAVFAALSGICVAAGYWTRPEGLLAGVTVCATLALSRGTPLMRRTVAAGAFVSIVGLSAAAYLTINGTVTDRLTAITASAKPAEGMASFRTDLPKGLPAALRDPRLDFSPKDPSQEVTRPGIFPAAWSILREWSDSLAIVFAVMTLVGLTRFPTHHVVTRRVFRLHASMLLSALFLQAAARGYLSSRHVIGLTFLSVPFAADAMRQSSLRLASLTRLSRTQRRTAARMAVAGLAAVGAFVHSKPLHPSRRPHFEAGKWLTAHAPKDAAVYDTRGWAAFESGLDRYDPYRLAQALSDSNVKFWVLEAGELESGSRRAMTLAALLNDGGRAVARFDRKPGRTDSGDVLVFAWSRPAWWDTPAGASASEPAPESTSPIDTQLRQAEFAPGETARP